MHLDDLSDEQLIARSREAGDGATEALDVLFRRYHAKLAGWCLRFCGNRE